MRKIILGLRNLVIGGKLVPWGRLGKFDKLFIGFGELTQRTNRLITYRLPTQCHIGSALAGASDNSDTMDVEQLQIAIWKGRDENRRTVQMGR